MTESATERDPLEVLGERVANGIMWLTEHDVDGAFHFWFKAGLTRLSPMPSLDDARREAWRTYYDNRVKWEILFARLNRLEKERGNVARHVATMHAGQELPDGQAQAS